MTETLSSVNPKPVLGTIFKGKKLPYSHSPLTSINGIRKLTACNNKGKKLRVICEVAVFYFKELVVENGCQHHVSQTEK